MLRCVAKQRLEARGRAPQDDALGLSQLPEILRRLVDGGFCLGDDLFHFALADRERRGADHRVADRAHDEAACEAVAASRA